MVCWDFINYIEPENDNFITNKGVQLKALMAMMERVAEPRDSGIDYKYGNIASILGSFFWGVWTYFTSLHLAILTCSNIFTTITLPYLKNLI